MLANRTSLEDSGLLTSDPHHVPGYGGYCPQFKFRYGKTFGQMTSSLMIDQEVATSGQTVLEDIVPDTSRRDEVSAMRTFLVQNRSHSKGDQKFVDKMTSGYAGFIPRSQEYFGQTYRDICRNSAADLELDHRKYDYKANELRFLRDVQEGKINVDKAQLPAHLDLSPRPLRPVAEKAEPYRPGGDRSTPEISPYSVFNTDPSKKFKSGFTGFVPRSRGLLGQGYPYISNNALSTFTRDTIRMQRARNQPITMHETQTQPPAPIGKHLFPIDTGMIPKYTGHVPGVRFRFGQTYGHSTENVRQVLPDVSS